MSNLLLITDVARLRKIFGRLAEDRNIRLRVVNNLEKGGEEITIEKPDVVFVQTHLSGLSADILLMHLKKQLGRKRSRFVLLAAPNQTSDTILKPYQGWLDTSADDSQLLSQLQHLLAALLNKPRKQDIPAPPELPAASGFIPQPVSFAESSALLGTPPPEPTAPPQPDTEQQTLSNPPSTPEPSLEDQGITYAPRQRLTVYSEFNSSFDSAVSSTPEPETLDQATPAPVHDWDAETIDISDIEPVRSKRGVFLAWLAPVVIAVVAITFLQHRAATKPEQTAAAPPPPPAAVPAGEPARVPAAAGTVPPAVAADQDRMSDKAVMTAIAESKGTKGAAGVTPSGTGPVDLPSFIPRSGFDKKYGVANPGWERYKGLVTEFKLLRESGSIKVIQVIDRGGNGVPESFMKGVLRQVSKTPAFTPESTEKKEGFEIQRGHTADNIRIVYYRDETGGKLRAFVVTWP